MNFLITCPQFPGHAHFTFAASNKKTNKTMSTRILTFSIIAGLVTYSTIGFPTIVFQLIGAAVGLYYLEFRKNDEPVDTPNSK